MRPCSVTGASNGDVGDWLGLNYRLDLPASKVATTASLGLSKGNAAIAARILVGNATAGLR